MFLVSFFVILISYASMDYCVTVMPTSRLQATIQTDTISDKFFATPGSLLSGASKEGMLPNFSHSKVGSTLADFFIAFEFK